MMLWGIRRNSAVGFFAQKFLAAFSSKPVNNPKTAKHNKKHQNPV